jgi:hypothetical protein
MIPIYKDRCGWEKYSPNTTYNWITQNEEENFISNLKRYPNNESLKYYLENPIKYTLNNEGFRSPDDFNLVDEGNVFLGCSYTFGVGHHLENVWSYKVNNQIGGKFWNLSIGGTGVMSHYRLLLGYYKELKIKNIFHYLPNYYRYEFIINGKPTICKVNEYQDEWKVQYGTLIEDSLVNNDQQSFIDTAFISAIKHLASEIGCNYYLLRNDDINWSKDGSLEARDLDHYTTYRQHLIYEEFIRMLGLEPQTKKTII